MGDINEILPLAWYRSVMAGSEILSNTPAADFAEIYYDLASDDHFWLRWRFRYFLQETTKLGLDPTSPMFGLDIGCGNGAVQRQLAAQTAWRADGCDLNRAALSHHSSEGARLFYYDINDRRPELREKYDFLLMFDVIEHIEKPVSFIASAAFHLKPGGYVFVNVPACQALYSRYDAVQGHHRRYDKKLLRQHLADAGLLLSSMRYWGLLLMPALIARCVLVDRKADADAVMRAGFRPPHPLASAVLSAALACESVLPRAPIGTSLLAIARKPS